MTADSVMVADDVTTAPGGGPDALGVQIPTPPAPAPLIGRAAEIDLVRGFVSDSARSGGALLLCGDAGVGKTALLGAAAASARADRMIVLSMSGVDGRPGVGYSALAQALRPLRPLAARLAPAPRAALESVFRGDEPGDDPCPPEPLLVLRAVVSLLRASAVDRPVLLIMDDLPRIDEPSAIAVAFAARRLGGSRVALLAAARIGETDLVDRARLPEHRVAPLDAVAAARLLRARFPRLAPRVARRVLAEADGNPLALAELPLALTEAQRTALRPLPEVLPLGPRLRALHGPRTEQLPAPSRWPLLLAALEGTGDLGVVAAACGTAGLEDLDPAERAGLIQRDRGARRVVFPHSLVRSTIVALAPSSERRRAHRALAEAVEDPDRRARHLAQATTGTDQRIARLVETAARGALRGGDAEGAVSGLWCAADLTPSGADRRRLLAEAAHVGAATTGDIARVVPLLAEAHGGDPAGRARPPEVVSSAWMLLHADGDVVTARRVLADAAAASWAGVPAEVVDDAMHVALEMCLDAGAPELWDDLAALRAGPGRDTADLPLLVGILSAPARTSPAVAARLDRMITTLGTETDPRRIVRIAAAAVAVDRGSGCRSALRRVVDGGRRGGPVTSAIRGLSLLCADDFLTGRWNECMQLADEGIDLCASHGYRLLAAPFRLVQARVAAARGDRATAVTLADEVGAWADSAGALDLAAAAAGGCTDDAVRDARALREAPLGGVSARFAMVAAGSAAIAASPDGAARELFEEALASPGGERWAFDHARIRLAYGRHLRRHREAAPARRHLHAALATFRRLAAEPWAAQARAELRAVGARTADGRRGSVLLHAALSPQEREVAGLAASGLTNKQIAVRLRLSPRTISARLYQIFPKLGVTSRAGLRDALSGLATSAAGTAP